jgi:Trypsin-like peptidase domain
VSISRKFNRFVFLAVVIVGITVEASPQTKGILSPDVIYERSRGSVVTILTFDSKKAALGQGSGFVVAHNRVITNYHVLAGSSSASIIFNDGSIVTANSVVAGSAPKDLVIVYASTGNRPALNLGSELQLKVGEDVYAIGAPEGLSASLSNGLVSAFRQDDGQFLIQVTASIAPGSSGGPLFNSQGQVVGITTSRLKDGSFGFAVGAGDIQHLLKVPLPMSIALSDLKGDVSEPDASLAPVQSLFDQKKFADAESSFRAMPNSLKQGFDGQLLLCRIESELSNYQLVLQACDAAISLRTADGAPYELKSLALIGTRDFASAEQNALRASQLSDDPEYKSVLGLIYYLEGKICTCPKGTARRIE